jgi:hypothetical protein
MDASNNHNGKINDFPEAPASWNTKYITPEGFECQITLRGDSGTELLEKAGKGNCLFTLQRLYSLYLL